MKAPSKETWSDERKYLGTIECFAEQHWDSVRRANFQSLEDRKLGVHIGVHRSGFGVHIGV
jgi:hypothetical protein